MAGGDFDRGQQIERIGGKQRVRTTFGRPPDI
jgi:hypothetical protein